MTRKQAITTIIDFLNKQENLNNDVKKAITKLEEMKNGIPGKIWDDVTIREAIDRFIKENDRPPLARELDTVEYLPPHPSIYQQYKKTAGLWLKENYPEYVHNTQSHPYNNFSNEEIKEIFIKDFRRVNPSSLAEYNHKKSRTTPCVTYLLKRLDAGTWNNLLDICGLKTRNKFKKDFKVIRHIDIVVD